MPSSLPKKIYHLSRACTSMSHLKQLIPHILQSDSATRAESLSALLSFAAAASSPHDTDLTFSSLLFSHIPNPNSFAYNCMIQALVNARLPGRALLLYLQMDREGSLADNYTYPFVLKASTLLSAFRTGEAVHARIARMGFLLDPYIVSGLVRMYSEFDKIDLARGVFDAMVERDCVLWSSMIGGYVKCGRLEAARRLFEEMPNKNTGAYNSMIGGYAKFGFLEDACRLFKEMPEKDVVSWNTMIGAYARAGEEACARKLFDLAPHKNVLTWSAIISGFSQSSRFSDALALFKNMLTEGPRPNQAILVSILSSCTHLGALEQGIWIHGYIDRQGFEIDDFLSSSLIDMYSKCGLLRRAISVFNNLDERDVCSWTSMIYGLAVHGHCREALDKFIEMEQSKVRPNDVTFLAILCACSHGGLIEEGREVFDRMRQVYGMEPKIEHYTCMADLFSRANLAEEAMELIESMPMQPDVFVWGALCGGLRINGRRHGLQCDADVSEALSKLKPRESGAYVLASNIYASSDRWEDAMRMRRMMEGLGVKKNAGCSLIEVDGVVNEFLASGRLHPKSELVYEMLDQLYRQIKIAHLT